MRWRAGFAAAMLLTATRVSWGIIYLGDHALEGLLVRCPVVVIATASSVDAAADRGVVTVEKALKGNLKGEATVKGVILRINARERRARFAAGDRVVLFMGQDSRTGALGVVASQKLAGEKETKAMEGCVAEVMPVAAVLADLANPRKELDAAGLRAAITKLVASENEYTKILVGRLMETRLAERVKPEGWEEVVVAGLRSKRMELRRGALVWAGKYATLPAEVRMVVEEISREKGALAEEARRVLGR